MPDLAFLTTLAASWAGAISRARLWAPLPWPILLLGETGSGKSFLAEHVHSLSGRLGALINHSMAQLPENLEAAELQGFCRGAFTGAVTARAGVFESAHRGAAFLDEIGLSSRSTQGILLKILDMSAVKRIGENRYRPIDFRLLAATNADLDAMVAAGEFRDDLLGRFGFYRIHLPPLRDRRNEVLPLAHGFLEAAARRLGRRAPLLNPEVSQLLQRAPWPHNVRDLENVCRYLCGNAGERANVADLPAEFLATMGIAATNPDEPPFDRLLRVITESGGSKTEAARRLGITRQYVHRLLNKHGLDSPTP